MYYSSVSALALLVHLIINIVHMRPNVGTNDYKTECHYRQFLGVVMCYYVTDILWGLLYERGLTDLCFVDTILYFIAVAFSVVFWTRFVVAYLEKESRFNKLLILGGWTILFFQLAILIINIFIPVAFKFDEDKVYVPGKARYVAFIAQIVLNIITMFYTLWIANRSSGKERSHHIAVSASGLMMSIFIILQMCFPLMPFYAAGCLLTTCIIHSFVYSDKMIEHARQMNFERIKSHKDPLTGVRNKLAYIETLMDIENKADSGELKEYGVVVFDVNDLKYTNDNLGHDAGDQLLKDACNLICQVFDHSPVFRMGGDEFAAILIGDPYTMRDALLRSFEERIDENQAKGNVVIASGYDIFNPCSGENYNDVFNRADKKMYERKQLLKDRKVKTSMN